VIGFPLLIIPFAIYNMIAFLTPGVSWTAPLYSVPLKSGVSWTATVGDAFLAFSLLMLMFEFIKSTRHGKSIVEHFIALVLACGAAAEFWMVREAGNSVFLLFVVICFVDLFAGFAASLRRARRTIGSDPVLVAPVPPSVPPVAPPVRTEPLRAEPVTRIEPASPARADPFVKVEPVQKVEP